LVDKLHPGVLEAFLKVQLLVLGNGPSVAQVLGLEMALKCLSPCKSVPEEWAALDCARAKVAIGTVLPLPFVDADLTASMQDTQLSPPSTLTDLSTTV
jgi:hypothetical protein